MSDQHSREEQILQTALQLATREERVAYLKGACENDPALLQRVTARLETGVSPNTDATIKSATLPDLPLIVPLTEKPGDRIGRYKLLQEIGEGGMGSVWMAEQEVPVRRRVALKVIKLGMDTKQVVARFEAERQALAMMDHPNIARVLDAGVTETGRPFFVMELVRGVSITEYCDTNNLSTNERLNLFIPVCHAIQHAHQKGIIHRDIKPSNVLVTLHDGVPMPKVIDFGIAKAVDQPLTEKTLFTRFEQFMGTPAYMSPEQAEMSGLDIDTRSDIYALGVLLYELLTGKTPFDSKELLASGVDAMRKTIREKEPVSPSGKLATLQAEELTTTARRRSIEVSRLLHQLKGDLDWIVMKCLEKDRTRRYETANGLAMDVQRYLGNEPVVARPPSASYRFQKLVRRNKLLFVAAAAVVTALALGMIGTVLGLVKADRQRRAAEAAQRQAQENFDQARAAVSDMLAVSDEDLYDAPGMQPLRVKLMRAAIDRYKPFLERPGADPAPRAELARLYVKYGFTATENGTDYATVAVPAYRSAFAIQEQLVREHPEDRRLRSDLGWTYVFYVWHGNLQSAESHEAREKAVAIFDRLVREAPSDPLPRADLAWALWQSTWAGTPGDREYMAYTERSIAIREQLVREFPQSAEFRRDLATTLSDHAWDMNDPVAALTMVTRATAIQEGLVADLEQNNPAIWQPERPRDSEARLLKVSLIWSKRDVALGCVHASRYQAQLKHWTEALSLGDRGTGIYRQLAEQNPSMRQFIQELYLAFANGAEVAEQSGGMNSAIDRCREAVSFFRTHVPADDPTLANALRELSFTLLINRKFPEAEAAAREGLSILGKKQPDDWRTFDARLLLGENLLAQKKYEEAEPLLLSGYEGLEQRAPSIPPAFKPRIKEGCRRLAKVYEAIGQTDKAAQWTKRAEDYDKKAAD